MTGEPYHQASDVSAVAVQQPGDSLHCPVLALNVKVQDGVGVCQVIHFAANDLAQVGLQDLYAPRLSIRG